MVLIIGIPGDEPLELVADALDEIGKPYVILNQRKFNNMMLEIDKEADYEKGNIEINGDIYQLDEFSGIYNRMVSYQSIPEYVSLKSMTQKYYCEQFHHNLTNWTNLTEKKVLNRNIDSGSNSSKPYQMKMIAKTGMKVPPSLISTNIESVKLFNKKHGELIYKSASGVRSIVKTLDMNKNDLSKISNCPVLFQKKIKGMNIRVHSVYDQLFTVQIDSEATDYRYASRDGLNYEIEAIELPDRIKSQCLEISKSLHLPLCGIDLILDDSGEYYCLEANPSPGFSFFEKQSGHNISHAIATALSN